MIDSVRPSVCLLQSGIMSNVPQRILFKVALVAFDCVRGQGPGYFDNVIVPVHTVGARARLRSADHGGMVVPRSYTVRFSQRSFSSSAPSVWNDLPSELKNSDISRQGFCARQHICYSAYMLSPVRPSVRHTGGSVKNG